MQHKGMMLINNKKTTKFVSLIGGLAYLVATLLVLLVVVAYYQVFLRLASGELSLDLYTHLTLLIQGMDGVVHRLFHYSVAGLAYLFGMNVLQSAVFTLLFYSFAAGVMLYFALSHYLKEVLGRQWILTLTVTLMVIAAIRLPAIHPYIFLGIGSPNPMHNPTTITVKPFAFATVLLMVYAAGNRTQKQFFVAVAAASVCLLLSVYAKPNFVIALIGAAPFILAYLASQNPMPAGRLRWFALPLALGLLALALQYVFLFGSAGDSDGGIGFGWVSAAGARGVNVNPFVAKMQLAAFPIAALILLPGILKDRLYVFSLLLFIVAALQSLLLHETGPRMYHGNFGWGVTIVAPMLFAAALGYAVRQMHTSWQSIPLWKSAVLVLIYLLHVDSGVRYLFQLLTGPSYH